jgi:hypothetical protein
MVLKVIYLKFLNNFVRNLKVRKKYIKLKGKLECPYKRLLLSNVY